VLPFSTILGIFEQKSYPTRVGFSATASYPQVGFHCFVDRKEYIWSADLCRKFVSYLFLRI